MQRFGVEQDVGRCTMNLRLHYLPSRCNLVVSGFPSINVFQCHRRPASLGGLADQTDLLHTNHTVSREEDVGGADHKVT